MKERPILFSAPMVRAILSGAKTQTRRAIRDQSMVAVVGSDVHLWTGFMGWQPFDAIKADPGVACKAARCPYGWSGDRLWGRENGWERPERTPKMMREGADTWAPYYFDADGISETETADLKAWGFKRRPSIHMPRAHSRILLEVTGVRVERLHAISTADCIAEGAPGRHGAIAGYSYNATPIEHYRHIWEAIGGRGSWQANPWVWVVEFRRATA